MLDVKSWADRLATAGVLPESAVASVCVGSVARGWSNPSSDIDFYVVTPDESTHLGRAVAVPMQPSCIRSAELEVNGEQAEVTFWTTGQVTQMLDKVTWEAFDRPNASLKSLTDPEELFLERLETGLPVTGEPWLLEQRAALRAGAYTAFVTARSVAESEGKVEDAQGLLAVGDSPSAVLAARMAYSCAVDALLDSNRVYGTRSPKWQARRVREANLVELPFTAYWALQSMADLQPGGEAQWVRSAALAAQSLVLETDIGGQP